MGTVLRGADHAVIARTMEVLVAIVGEYSILSIIVLSFEGGVVDS
jgi:hypothetical protein